MKLGEKIKNILVSALQGFTISCLLRPYYKLFYNIRLKNRRNIPKKGTNYIIVANHISLNDPPLLASIVGANIAFIAKQELFKVPVLGFLISLVNTIPVNREKVESSTIKQAKRILQIPGWHLGLFIEGTRSKIEGQLGKPFQGAIFMAKLCKVGILPIGIEKNKRDIKVNIGELYMPDLNLDLEEQTWDCLEKISKLSNMRMPPRH